MGALNEKTFLLIAGQPKAGTTSLYNWLKQHPQVCAATLKETRFFLDADYPLSRPATFDGGNLDAYGALFTAPDRAVFMEATPDYMFSPGILRAAEALPKAFVVVLIREPVSRLISAYRFFRQRGLLKQDMSFDAWIAYQNDLVIEPGTPPQYRALDHCDLDKHLPPLRAAFGDRLIELDFQALQENPLALVNAVAGRLSIEPVSEDALDLSKKNITVAPRWPAVTRLYSRIHRETSQRLTQFPLVRNVLRPVSRVARKAINSKRVPQTIAASDASIEIINRKA